MFAQPTKLRLKRLLILLVAATCLAATPRDGSAEGGFLEGVGRMVGVGGKQSASDSTGTTGTSAPPSHTAPADAGIPEDTGTDRSAYMIGPQNLVNVRVFGESGLQQTFRVDDNGFITYPMIGRVRVGGLTIAEAERLIEDALKDGYMVNPQVSMFVLEHSRFSILGEIRSPGTYEILGRVTLVEAISLAGGFTPGANQGAVKIMRRRDGDGGDRVVNTNRIMQGQSESEDVPIVADDVIVVPKRFF